MFGTGSHINQPGGLRYRLGISHPLTHTDCGNATIFLNIMRHNIRIITTTAFLGGHNDRMFTTGR